MLLNDLLDKVIFKEAYEPIKVRQIIPSPLPVDAVKRLEDDKDFFSRYEEKLSEMIKNLGYKDISIVSFDPSSHNIEIEYTAYYSGRRHYPEIHLKTLLIINDSRGFDIRDPDIFMDIVIEAKDDLKDPDLKEKEDRMCRFAYLFKEAIDEIL